MAVKQRRGTLLVSTVVGTILRLGNTAYAGDPTYRFDIPPESLSQALTDFSQAAAQQIIYSESIVKGRSTSGLHGSYTAAQALQALLAGTDLKVDINSTGVLMIRTKSADTTRNVSTPISDAKDDAPPMQRTAYQTSASQAPAASTPSPAAQPAEVSPSGDEVLSTVVITGSTSKRTLLDASVSITSISNEDLQQKAPRNTVDVLTLIPGIFVEGTAGPVSNNYSVRGLPGGGQAFVRLIEDGMAPIYGGLNDDEVFQYDLSIDHVESLQGGTSGILTPNGAGATINFISRKLNFDQGGGLAQVMGTTYGERRADAWFSAPIAPDLAFAASAYYDSNPGTRDSPFRYDTWHTKLQLEKRFDNGASVRFTWKRWDEHDPYYADQPYAYNNGKIRSVPGLDSQFGNIIGRDFAYITVPDSCVNECFRTFSANNGIHATGSLYRIDLNAPINDSFSVFARARYTQTDWDFNGVFAGSGTGNGGLASAVTYLTPGANSASPIASLLTAGQAAFPAATQFGIRNVATGQVIPASNVAALNALNGNGLLQQTVLNQQLLKQRDWGSDFGVKWDMDAGDWTNSLTVGGMLFSVHQSNDQSGVAPVINDVVNQSNIYDVVALNSAGGVLGTLTNNGLVSYGDWGAGISYYNQNSESLYLNNEFTWNKKLHFDFGVRAEHEAVDAEAGNSASLPIPAGVQGINQVNPNAFNGTFNYSEGSENPVNWTAGVNYTFSPILSAYARYEKGYQTNGTNDHPTRIVLYEAGITYANYGLTGTLRGFRTEFDNQSFGGGVDPANPNLNLGFFGNSDGNGVDLDATYRPEFEPLHAFSLHAQATYQTPTFSNVSTGATNIVSTIVAQEANAFYNGKTPGRTPNVMYTLTPAYDLPAHYGQVYLNYQYIGRIFADNGNQVSLPGYGVLSVGAICNITPNLALNISVTNVTNELGLTEGNPRQGFTQQIVNGYFYGRGIVGPTGLVSLTYRFE